MLIATVSSRGTHPGSTITYQDGQFVHEGIGELDPQLLRDMDARDELVWVSEEVRTWFVTNFVPASPASVATPKAHLPGWAILVSVALAVVCGLVGYGMGSKSGTSLGFANGSKAGYKKGHAAGLREGVTNGQKSAEIMNDSMFEAFDFIYFPFKVESGGTYVVQFGKTDDDDSPIVQKAKLKATWCSDKSGDGSLQLVYVPYSMESGNWYAMKIKQSSKGDDLPGVLREFEATQFSVPLRESKVYTVDGDSFYASKKPSWMD